MGGSKSIGCMITYDDKSRVLASFSIYFAILARGICVGMLGAAIPILAKVVGVAATSFGEIFSARGIGYMSGTMLATALLHIPSADFSKHGYTCLAIIFAGLCTMCFAFTLKFRVMLMLSAGQGIGFGVMHTFATIALLEMWGQRAQLWLQVKPSALGMGGAIGPVLVSWLGYQNAFVAAGIVCTFCVVIYAVEYFLTRTRRLARWSAKKLHLRTSSKQRKTQLREGCNICRPGIRSEGVCMPQQQIHSYEATAVSPPSLQPVAPSLPSTTALPEVARSDNHFPQSDVYGDFSDYASTDMYISSDLQAVQRMLTHEVRRLSMTRDEETAPPLVCGHGHTIDCSSGTIVDEALGPYVYHSLPSPRWNECGEDRQTATVAEMRPILASTSPAAATGAGPVVETLAFATPDMVSDIHEIESHSQHRPVGVTMIPLRFQYFLCVFLFVDYGLFYSYGGWITSYSSLTGLAVAPADASYLTSVFYMWVTVGSVMSLPCAMLISTTALLRLQLAVVAAGVGVLVTVGIQSYQWLSVASALVGYGASCIFPLVVCLGSDYNFTMDAQATALMIVSGTIGESLVPVMTGKAMEKFGPYVFPTCMTLLAVVMIVSYALAHLVALRLAGMSAKQFFAMLDHPGTRQASVH